MLNGQTGVNCPFKVSQDPFHVVGREFPLKHIGNKMVMTALVSLSLAAQFWAAGGLILQSPLLYSHPAPPYQQLLVAVATAADASQKNFTNRQVNWQLFKSFSALVLIKGG